MTSTVVWHRFWEAEPPLDVRVLLEAPSSDGLPVIARLHKGHSGKLIWTSDTIFRAPKRNDLWCLLPIPPKEES